MLRRCVGDFIENSVGVMGVVSEIKEEEIGQGVQRVLRVEGGVGRTVRKVH